MEPFICDELRGQEHDNAVLYTKCTILKELHQPPNDRFTTGFCSPALEVAREKQRCQRKGRTLSYLSLRADFNFDSVDVVNGNLEVGRGAPGCK